MGRFMWLFLARLELCQILISVQVTTQKHCTEGGKKNQGAVGLPGWHKVCCKFAIKTNPIGSCTGAKHPLSVGHCQRKWQSRLLEQQECWHPALHGLQSCSENSPHHCRQENVLLLVQGIIYMFSPCQLSLHWLTLCERLNGSKVFLKKKSIQPSWVFWCLVCHTELGI